MNAICLDRPVLRTLKGACPCGIWFVHSMMQRRGSLCRQELHICNIPTLAEVLADGSLCAAFWQLLNANPARGSLRRHDLGSGFNFRLRPQPADTVLGGLSDDRSRTAMADPVHEGFQIKQGV